MQISRTIDTSKHVVYATVTGEITMEEVCADLRQVAAQKNHQPELPGIIDMRKATTHLTADEIQQLAGFVTRHPKAVRSTRRALLVETDVMFGLYRMFSVYAGNSSVEFEVFRDEQKALEWVRQADPQEKKIG